MESWAAKEASLTHSMNPSFPCSPLIHHMTVLHLASYHGSRAAASSSPCDGMMHDLDGGASVGEGEVLVAGGREAIRGEYEEA